MRNTRESGQILRSKKRLHPTIRNGRGSRTNSNTSQQIQAPLIEAHSTGRGNGGGVEIGSTDSTERGSCHDRSPFDGLACRDRKVTSSGLPALARARVDTKRQQYDRSACKQNLYSLSRGNSSPHARAT